MELKRDVFPLCNLEGNGLKDRSLPRGAGTRPGPRYSAAHLKGPFLSSFCTLAGFAFHFNHLRDHILLPLTSLSLSLMLAPLQGWLLPPWQDSESQNWEELEGLSSPPFCLTEVNGGPEYGFF